MDRGTETAKSIGVVRYVARVASCMGTLDYNCLWAAEDDLPWLDLSSHYRTQRLSRLRRLGLIEPLEGIESLHWDITPLGRAVLYAERWVRHGE